MWLLDLASWYTPSCCSTLCYEIHLDYDLFILYCYAIRNPYYWAIYTIPPPPPAHPSHYITSTIYHYDIHCISHVSLLLSYIKRQSTIHDVVLAVNYRPDCHIHVPIVVRRSKVHLLVYIIPITLSD